MPIATYKCPYCGLLHDVGYWMPNDKEYPLMKDLDCDTCGYPYELFITPETTRLYHQKQVEAHN